MSSGNVTADSMREIAKEESGVVAQSQPPSAIAQALRKHCLKLITATP